MSKSKNTRDLYKDSGVDIDKGDRLVEWLQDERGASANVGGSVVSGIGGFAGLFRPNFAGMKDPILVASTDGVGTKLLLGIQHERLAGLGQDLVGMCVNDLYCVGARPLFFLDYYATGKLSEDQFQQVLGGMKKALQLCDCVLLGGETAELPGLYERGHFDLAGFVIGAVDGAKTLGPDRVKAGDIVLGVASTGFHSNGYSLIRSWLAKHPQLVTPELIEQLLAPTAIYGFVPKMLATDLAESVHSIAHITGGGLSGNLARVLPNDLSARIERALVPTPGWMRNFIDGAGANVEEVERFFNLGVGLTVVVEEHEASSVAEWIRAQGFEAFPLGNVVGRGDEPIYYV